ncbi:hemolysin family protein [Pseudalkalibacillus salsuginis]|uniref:hemolysin family protein n=1 Tax=Pseudalkalibacillus salsuginis TaxID=2910972 RepID=UPI001F19F277|nr:hemolysin family protein [Pseudalkalibacillus salsuginis]MCF6412011.1 hemolysin family protein [Pseudalkalibacillus salsuginis]
MIISKLLSVAILIALTAFFVAAEFAIVKVRSTKIDKLVDEGNKKAVAARKVLDNLDGYLSACQLGITITALGLGWLGEPTVELILHPLFEEFAISEAVASTLSFVIAFSAITFFHVVLGELAPKTIAIQKAEELTLMLSKPLILFYKIMYPFIWMLNGSARIFIKLLGFRQVNEHEVAHSEEELRIILSESYKSGEINKSELHYVNKIFEFDDRTAKEIMVPRTEMVCMFTDQSIEENIAIMSNEKFTRYPVADGDKDHIIGLVNIKEVFNSLLLKEERPLSEFIRPVLKVIETTPIKKLLVQMQKERVHMMVLVDEYGGTAGLVTVEDIIEEIVGEIRDEFDTEEKPQIEKIDRNHAILDGKALISDVNEVFNIDIDDSELDTIGGWLLTQNAEVSIDEEYTYEHVTFKIIEADDQQIKRIDATSQ